MSCSKNCKCRPGVVAFIFVPGIMGSRLQNKKSGKLVWDPSSGFDYEGLSSEQADDLEKLSQEFKDNKNKIGYKMRVAAILLKKPWNDRIREIRCSSAVIRDFAFASPEKRKKMFVNDNPREAKRDDDLLEVASGDSEYFKKCTDILSKLMEKKQKRGWGEVLWNSYGPFLHYLENQEQELKQLYPGLRFPVFAVGYNWMLSNKVAGERIKKKLIEFKAQILEEDDRNISEEDIKFIIISHSMGGIASRSAFMLSNLASEVEAVIHCAMPTYGSPDTYRRMRCGQDGITKFVIGKNAAEITAILAYSQGGLELLPNQLYKTADNKDEWLLYATDKTSEGQYMPIKYGAEIYEFYKQYDVWYSLIQPDLLAPGLPNNKKNELNNYTSAYKNRIEAAKLFHQQLANGFHPTTTLIYSNNPKHKSYDKCCWRGKKSPNGNINQWKVIWDQSHNPFNMTGSVILKGPSTEDSKQSPNKIEFTIDPATAKGDGTVHIGSGQYAIAAGGLKKIPIKATKDHQDILNCPNVKEKVISEIKTWLEDIHHKMGG